MNHIPEMDAEGVSAAYEIRVRAVLGGELPDELRLRDRLDPQHWALEWNLARWLGQAYGLEPRLSAEICLSNVLGLASIRLRDDLEDGELSAPTRALSAAQTSDRLYEEALLVYRRTFDPESVFWTYLHQRMDEWRAATVDGGSPGQLAGRGAPLKVSAFAVCLLAERQDQFPVIDRCLDHALAGMVRYDHLVDWRDDLAAGRWNAFVAASTEARKGARASGPDVQVTMMTTDVIPAYFALIVEELNRAATLAAGAGVHGLASHLTQTARDLEEQGVGLADRYREISERAQHLVFGIQPRLAA